MNPVGNTPSSPKPPANPSVLPLGVAALAVLVLGVVAALFLARRDREDAVVEEPPSAAPETAAASSAAPETEVPRTEPREGDVFEARVTGLGSKGDGRLNLRGKTVYIPGTQTGETVRFRITRDTGRFLLGERAAPGTPLTVLAPVPAPQPVAMPQPLPPGSLPPGVLDGATAPAEAVLPGVEFSVVVTDHDRYAPGTNGFCRIDGFAVVVARAPPGPDRVRIRLTERLERRAAAELVK